MPSGKHNACQVSNTLFWCVQININLFLDNCSPLGKSEGMKHTTSETEKPTYIELVNDLLWIRRQVRFVRQNSTNPGMKSFATIIEARTENAKAIAQRGNVA